MEIFYLNKLKLIIDVNVLLQRQNIVTTKRTH